jgi:hypothetical protein
MIGQLIEELCVANIKLFMVCDKKADAAKSPEKYTKKELQKIMAQDIALCKRRAQLKSRIDKVVSDALLLGEMDGIEEIKSYGSNH